MKGMLMDSTRCIGCRGCQVACKEWNNLPAEETDFFGGAEYQNPQRLSSKTWTLITFNNCETEDGFDWVFGKLQCLHCLEPVCVTVCPVSALEKSASGAVVYHASRCIGCRHCQLACPFDVPAFDWDKPLPEIGKCNFCFDRIEAGMEPACAKTCPTAALVFGDRDAVIREGERRISSNPGGYVNHIYGRSEVGGTSVLHLASAPFEKLGLPAGLPSKPLTENARIGMEPIPYVMAGLGLALGGLNWIVNRRMENEKSKNSEGGAS